MEAHSLPTPIPHQISPHRGSLSLKSNVAVCCLPLLAMTSNVIYIRGSIWVADLPVIWCYM